MGTNRTKGVIDLHIHSGPDVKTRKMNDLELMEAAVRLGVRAVVIKSHHVPTVDRATLTNLICKERYPEANFSMFGGIALNQSVGGLNPYAVESALRLGAKVVWLPTLDAENQCKKDGLSICFIATHRRLTLVYSLRQLFLIQPSPSADFFDTKTKIIHDCFLPEH